MVSSLSRALLFAAVIVLALTACRTSGSTPDTSLVATLSGSSPVLASPLPTPTHSASPGFATLDGTLVLLNPTIVALQEDGLYLVRVEAEGKISMVMPIIDPKTSLQANVNETTGEFSFADVPPGLYAMMAMADSGQQFSVREFGTGEISTIVVNEEDLGRVVDLGMWRLP